MIDRTEAEAFARDWIEAWNACDPDAILAHYAEDVDYHSPFVAAITGAADGRLSGREALRDYLERALAGRRELAFELHQVLTGTDSVVLYYRSVGGRLAAELFRFDENGKVAEVRAHYTEPQA